MSIAWPSDAQVDLMTHHDHRGLENEMLQWAEAGHVAGTDATKPLTAWSFDHDHARTTVLAQRGYTRTGEHFVSRTRSLAGNFSAPTLPSSFTICNVEGEADVEPRVEVHRAAFAPSRMTAAKHRAVMAAPTYRPELDLLVVAPDGRFAAFCIVWFDEANRLGVFEPVGCPPRFSAARAC